MAVDDSLLPDSFWDGYDGWSVLDIQKRFKWTATKLLELSGLRREVAETLAAAGPAHTKARAQARIRHRAELEAQGVKVTEARLDDYADIECEAEALTLSLAKEMKLALNHEMENLREVKSVLQSVNKDARWAEGAPQ